MKRATLRLALEVFRYAFNLRRFGRETAYHMWSSKLWGIALFAAFMSLLAFGKDGYMVDAAIYIVNACGMKLG